jgi:hypothetical protein
LIPPSDKERILDGRLYHPTKRGVARGLSTINRRRSTAPVGFVLE